MLEDGVVQPSPACSRALQQVVTALVAGGHDVVTVYVNAMALCVVGLRAAN